MPEEYNTCKDCGSEQTVEEQDEGKYGYVCVHTCTNPKCGTIMEHPS